MTHNNIITMQEQYNKTYDTIVIYKTIVIRTKRRTSKWNIPVMTVHNSNTIHKEHYNVIKQYNRIEHTTTL